MAVVGEEKLEMGRFSSLLKAALTASLLLFREHEGALHTK